MFVGIGRFELYLLDKPGSLKEKRALVRRLRDRIRSRCRVSASEVGDQELHHRAVLAVALVAAGQERARSLMDSARQLLLSEPRVEVLHEDVEIERWA